MSKNDSCKSFINEETDKTAVKSRDGHIIGLSEDVAKRGWRMLQEHRE